MVVSVRQIDRFLEQWQMDARDLVYPGSGSDEIAARLLCNGDSVLESPDESADTYTR